MRTGRRCGPSFDVERDTVERDDREKTTKAASLDLYHQLLHTTRQSPLWNSCLSDVLTKVEDFGRAVLALHSVSGDILSWVERQRIGHAPGGERWHE